MKTNTENKKWIRAGQGTLKTPSGNLIKTEVIEQIGQGRIFEVYDYSNDDEANIALISAAQELLEACLALIKAESMQTLGKRDGVTMGQISSAIDLARAAISKAPGGVK
jgi:hypothetical protein